MTRFPALPLGQTATLAAGTTRAVVAPACGARLLRFDAEGVEVMRPAPKPADGISPYRFAGFPLVPYSGPIFSGGFAFGNSRYGLARNVAPEADATHGHGWILPWEVTAETPDRLELALDYRPAEGGFPFAWRATLGYSVRPGTLTIEMTLANADIRPMPAGFGYHPYFARPPGSTLRFRHGRVWPPDAPEAVTGGSDDPPVGLDFNSGIVLDRLVADRCFDDWDGLAVLTAPDREVRLTASRSFGKLQLYCPWYDPYVCIEPVSNANDGFNRAAQGVAGHAVVVLEPGETLQGSLTIVARIGEGP